MALTNLNWTVEYYEENSQECDDILNSLEDYDSIPLISSSLHDFKDGTLIRYIGMIQDMLNPEFYSSYFTITNKETNESYKKSGKFRDVACCKANEEINVQEVSLAPNERLIFFCVPIPGTNEWVHNCKKEQSVLKEKQQHSNLKRSANDRDLEMDIDIARDASQSDNKRSKSNENENQCTLLNNIYSNSKYFPFPDEIGLPCIIKVYEDEEQSKISLNDRIEVLGFLSLNPVLGANWEDADIEDKAMHPPPSVVPRIHSIKIRKLKHCNPLLKEIVLSGDNSKWMEAIMSDLHLVLTQLLFEDTLAAKYLVCNLISRVYIRNEGTTLGKFSLNLFNINLKNFGTCFYEILKMLVTNSHFLPMSTQLFNEKSFIPKKDYESNRLWSGILQLCEDVYLVLDETKMNEGKLDNTGCLNFAALQKLIRDQEIQYDFGYYPVTYNANNPVLIFSEGKSMFKVDVQLKVKTEGYNESNLNESLQAVKAYLNEDVLKKIRVYLTYARLQDFELGEEMMKKIGEDYISMRQQNREVNSSDLHALLVLSRLLALSHGRTSLSLEDWTQAVEMEAERKARLG